MRRAASIPTVAIGRWRDTADDGRYDTLAGWRDIPTELKERISADIRAVGADPDIGAKLIAGGSTVTTGTPAEFAAAIEEQRAKVAAFAALIGPGFKP